MSASSFEDQSTLPGPGVSGQVASRASDPDPLVGKTLKGTYHLIRKLAEGGMGAVYQGEHVRLGRKVAVKLMLARYSTEPEVVARFRREAEIVGQLGHPHIVQVFDVDETEAGAPYLVMEYLEGETLAERLGRERRLPVSAAVELVSQIASALASTHEHGIVHRDMKPENVFLLRVSGEEVFPKVLDFGIGKMRGAARITVDRCPIGTPSYMAPEQVTSASSVDASADQFALAAMAFEMLSGEPAFPGETPDEILDAVLRCEPARLSAVAPWLGAAFDDVVARGLARDPAARFPSISQFAWALGNAASAAGLSTPPPGSADDAGRYRVSSETPPSSSRGRRSRRLERAERLLADALRAERAGELDDAVFYAEKLLDVAAHEPSPAMYDLLATAILRLDAIFAARVGPLEGRLWLGPVDPRRLNLTPRAAALRSLAEDGPTVRAVLAQSGVPRRDAMRMLAGLLRRGALVAQ